MMRCTTSPVPPTAPSTVVEFSPTSQVHERIFTLKWNNLATPLRIILGKSLKKNECVIKKHRITKFFRVIFFHFKALSCIP